MAWLWPSLQRFKEVVVPHFVEAPGHFDCYSRFSAAQLERQIAEEAVHLGEALEVLGRMGLSVHASRPGWLSEDQDSEAKMQLCIAGHAGESLLLLDRRLALTEGGSEFIGETYLLGEWDRYGKEGRLVIEIPRFVKAGQSLLQEVDRLATSDAEFLVRELDLPDGPMADFLVARDLFSIGQEEYALLACARGLERTLARIVPRPTRRANGREGDKGASRDPEESTLHQLVEQLDGLVWKTSGRPVLDKQTRALLVWVTRIRNACAHGRESAEQTAESAPEKAILIGTVARNLWRQASNDKAVRRRTAVRRKPGPGISK
jgi:hypothetical protein